MKNALGKVQHRRRREQKTDYRIRYGLLKSGIARLVIRRSSKNITVQVVLYSVKGDQVIASATSMELKKYGWKAGTGNIPASYLTGLLAGKMVKGKVDNVILDIGSQVSMNGGRIYSALKGFIDSGIKVPFSENVLPSEERISGKHIVDWAAKSGGNNFKKYGIDPKEIQNNFNEVKKKINGE
jgi:large subunit ribosomal protein L18